MKEEIILTSEQLRALMSGKDVVGFEGWMADADVDTGEFDAEKGSMTDYEITLEDPEGNVYRACDGYYNAIAGHCFNGSISFYPKEEETEITISIKEYEQLQRDSCMLNCLEQAGVDNWQGYEDAIDIFKEHYEL